MMKILIWRKEAKMNKWSELSWRALFYFLVIVFAGSMVLTASAADGLKMEAKAGFGGCARSGQITPVQVMLENNGPGITAYLEISTLSGNKQVLYRKQVVLASGSKKAIDMNIPVYADQDYSVRLVSGAEKKLLAESRLRVSCIEDNALLVGVLAKSKGSLDYLQELRLSGSDHRVTVAYLKEDDLPVNELFLDSINVLVFYDYSFERLPVQKSQAIKEWIKNGGMLVQNRFQAGEPAGENAKEMAIDGKSIYCWQLGRGSIYQLGGSDAAVEMGGIKLWEYLLNRAESSPLILRNKMAESMDTIESTLSTIPASDLPTTGWLAVIYIIYIVILGPGTYLVLKRLDRREWGWAVVPLLAMLLFSLTYIYGFKGKGWHAFTSVVSLVNLEANNDQARVNSVLGVFAPTQSNYSIKLPGRNLVSLLSVDIGGNGSVMPKNAALKTPFAALIEQGSDTRVEFDDTSRWSLRCIRSETIGQMGQIDSKLKMNNGKVSGMISNLTGYNLNDCVVFSRYNYQYIGKLEAGQSVQIDFIPYISGQKGAQTFQRMEENYPVNWPQQDRNIGRRDKAIKKQLTAAVANSYDFMDGNLLLVGYSAEVVNGTLYENKKEKRYAVTAFAAPLLLNADNAGKVSVPPGIINASLLDVVGPNCSYDEWGYNLKESKLVFQTHLPCSPYFNFDEVRIFVPGVDYRMQEVLSIKVFNWVSGNWDEVGCAPAGSLLKNARQYVGESGSVRIMVANLADEYSDYVLYFPGLTVSYEGSY